MRKIGSGTPRWMLLVALPALFCGPARAALVGHWQLDETGAATTAADSSGSGNTGNLSGNPAWYAKGKIGGAIDFPSQGLYGYDGSDDYVEIPNSATLENVQEGDEYSLAAWVCADTDPSDVNPQESKSYSIIGKAGWHSGIEYNANQEFIMVHYVDESATGGSSNVWKGAGSWGTAYPTGTWHHVVAAVSKTAGTITVYVNNEVKGSGSFTAGRIRGGSAA